MEEADDRDAHYPLLCARILSCPSYCRVETVNAEMPAASGEAGSCVACCAACARCCYCASACACARAVAAASDSRLDAAEFLLLASDSRLDGPLLASASLFWQGLGVTGGLLRTNVDAADDADTASVLCAAACFHSSSCCCFAFGACCIPVRLNPEPRRCGGVDLSGCGSSIVGSLRSNGSNLQSPNTRMGDDSEFLRALMGGGVWGDVPLLDEAEGVGGLARAQAAARCIGDIWAMGGTPLLLLLAERPCVD